MALSYIDQEVGKLIQTLGSLGELENTIIVLTADHGNGWDPERDANLSEDFGFRTHYEHIRVPLIICHPHHHLETNKLNPGKGLYDSMSVSATILDLLNVDQDPTFKGHSILNLGKTAIISENSGRGNCNISSRDLYFTITSASHKLFVLLESNTLTPKRLYDLRHDPRELVNIIDQNGTSQHVKDLMKELFIQRAELLDTRGVTVDGKN